MTIKEVDNVIRLSGLLLCAIIFLMIGNTPALADGEGIPLQATMAEPEFYAPVFLEEMSPVSPEEMERREEALERTHLPGPPLPRANLPIAPPSKESQTSPMKLSNTEGSEGEGLLLLNPEDFMIGLNRLLGSGAPDGYKSTVGEPSFGQSGKYVFYSGNWYAARSTLAGFSWSFVDPYADFSDFCCDQEVIYDQSRDIFLWYRQGIEDGSGENVFKLGISNDGGATWYVYTIAPSNLGWSNEWWDYPHLALSNDYLYIASNVYDQYDNWTRTVLLRWPLDELKDHVGFSYSYIAQTDRFNFTPVQGATDIMYWGTHNTTSSFRVYRWNEDSGSYFWYDRDIPAWTSTPSGSAYCPGPDGYNWCARTDHRVLSGWVAQEIDPDTGLHRNVIGFFWNVKEGGGFSYPYVNAARFLESDFSYLDRPYIYSGSYAWMYASAAPDSRGNLGIGAWWGGGNVYYPNFAVGVDDDYNGIPPGWSVWGVSTGTNGPSNEKWGDYCRVRQIAPHVGLWGASSYVLDGGSSGSYTEPRFTLFLRERDSAGAWRWALK